MRKNYLIALFLFLALSFSSFTFGQDGVNRNPIQETIEQLSIYPNPVTNGKTYIYITTKHNLTKKIEFFDVLGKRIFTTMLTGKELNISNFNKGVYIIKVTENNMSETRKLVIR
ncbi:T9SS type A sorting domain-containing protein [Aestuariibaculum sediminum]|uniref:T9SS type A sorting domain-containing protein n=1 Tax=Aestuariibaculum sediminum TaxID=2770637 RepID=A0A8J6PYD4_9FLAO|nr:T9SS type A sorting domain-containing protein [Aestuariibaculum sediminum]MBD0830933.1 T9SS type A sorting domain-containing protein [Aestuariibaculum sediminum]